MRNDWNSEGCKIGWKLWISKDLGNRKSEQTFKVIANDGELFTCQILSDNTVPALNTNYTKTFTRDFLIENDVLIN